MRRLLKAVSKLVFFVFGLLISWLTLAKIIRHFIHFPAPAFIGYFLDSDLRRKMQPVAPLIARSGIAPGMSVLEVGCGSGAFTTFVARAVGGEGEVAALDIQPAMLAQLARKLQQAENADIQNVHLHEGSATNLPFDASTFDVVYMITVLPEIPDQQQTLLEVNRVLKPGGVLAVSEFFPDPDYPLPATTVKRCIAQGFELDGVYGNLWTYTARFRKPV